MGDKILLFKNKADCCGCGACVNICPKHAIKFEKDEYGFMYPEIDDSLCIRCGLCKKVCCFQNVSEQKGSIKCYAAAAKNAQITARSSSGGIFAVLAKYVMQKKGVVFGAVMSKENNAFVVKHILVDNEEELYRLQGSKYIQSNIGNTYIQARDILDTGRLVLFSGTPCQIAGLKGVLGKKYKNLLTVDIICHGVPNAEIFNNYIKVTENRAKMEIVDYIFRNKEKGWGLNIKLNCKKNNKEHFICTDGRTTSFYKYFLDNLLYRESCYNCKYTSDARPADITLGDFWGIEKEHPEILDNYKFSEMRGISCVIINTPQGVKFFDSIYEDVFTEESDFERISRNNAQLRRPCIYNKKRDILLDIYKKEGYGGIERYFNKTETCAVVKRKLVYMIPKKWRSMYRRLKK